MVVDIVAGTGRFVARLMNGVTRAPGELHLSWNGRASTGARAPDGAYYPTVTFPVLHRTVRLPDEIVLDSRRPRVDMTAVRVTRQAVVVRYRFGEPARPVLLVGHRTVATGPDAITGTLRWPHRLGVDAHVTLIAVDVAGNRSRPVRLLPPERQL